jgi:myo-inositol 2-dehydrogenase/D-chiro-inositol 1-dehydrogenase
MADGPNKRECEPVRIGLIGVGRHAREILLPALALVPELQLCAVSTAHAETARAAEERYRVPAFVGYEAMLRNGGLDAALVVGGQHAPEILACLHYGVHVWCETPAVTSLEIAHDVRAVARETGRLVEVGSCLRHAPLYRRLQQELEAWRAEDRGPRLFQCRYYPYIGHFYNLLLWLNGPIAEVCATRGDAETLVLLRFRNGDLGSVTSRRFYNDSIPYEELSISGETGLLTASNGQELRRYRSRAPKPAAQLTFDTSDVSLWCPSFSLPHGELSHLYLRGYVPELQHFARRVRLGEPSVSGIDDLEQTLRVRQAVERSCDSRQWEAVVGSADDLLRAAPRESEVSRT